MDIVDIKLSELQNQVYNINCCDVKYVATLIRDINMYNLSIDNKYLLNQYVMMLIETLDLNYSTNVSFLEDIINKLIVKNLEPTFYVLYLNAMNVFKNGTSANCEKFFDDYKDKEFIFLNLLQKTSYTDLMRKINDKITNQSVKVEIETYISKIQTFKMNEIKYPLIINLETEILKEKVGTLEKENAELQYYLMIGGII